MIRSRAGTHSKTDLARLLGFPRPTVPVTVTRGIPWFIQRRAHVSSVPQIRRLANGPMLPPVRHPLWGRCRRVLGRLGLLGVVLLGLVLAHRPLLVGFARLFRVDAPAPADAILVLLGGFDH